MKRYTYLVALVLLLVRATAAVFHGSPSVVVDLESLTQKSSPDHEHESPYQHVRRGPSSASSLVDDGFTHKWMRDLASHHSLNRGNRLSLRRSLAIGDFDALNELLKGASIALPDATVSRKILFTDLVLNITNLVCTDITVGDIVVSYNKESSQKLSLQLDILDLDMNCTLDYEYDYGFLNGEGSAEAQSNNNEATMVLGFTSVDFDVAPPTASSMDSCIAKINVDNIEFDGGVVSSILDVFQDLIGNVVEDEVEDLACNELGDMGVTFIVDMLELASEMLEPYLQDTTPEATDPLAAENAMVVTDGVELLNFQEKNSTIGQLLDAARIQIDALLGTVVDDPDGPAADQKDLGVNVLLRKYLLDEDRAFTLNISDLFADGMLLYEGRDKLMDAKVELNSIKIFGLDSFTKFAPLVTIGKYTFQNEMAWSFLNLELNITINIKPSTLDDSFIETPSVAEVVETVKVEFGVDNLDTGLTLLLAIDQAALLELQLGPLLDTNKILPCLFSSLFEVQLSEFEVQVGNIRTPSLEDFVSPGIGRVVSTAAEALFLMFEASIIDAVPNVFRVQVKDIVNGDLLKTYLDNPENLDCSSGLVGGGFVDFRDLLLSPDLALSAGGSGLAPYGDLAHTLMTLLREQLSEDISSINSLLPEELSYPGDLFNQESKLDVGGLQARIELKASNARVEGLNTFGEPIDILQPVLNEPSILNNTAAIGVGSDPLRFAVTLLISLTGDDNMQLRNEVDISLDLKSASIIIGALLKISEEPFLSMPLKSMTNLYCWMATIPAPPLDSRGVRVADYDPTAALTQLVVSLAQVDLNITCRSCTSPDLEDLATILSSPEAKEDATEVANKVINYATKLLGGEFLQIQIDRMLNDAAVHCPHNAAYQPDPPQAVYEPFEGSDRKENSVTFLIAMVVAAAILFAVVTIVVLAVRWIVNRRNKAWLKTLTNEHIVALYKEQKNEQEVNQATKSMFTSSTVPWYIRFSMPLIILGNIAFFLSGHLSLGATVNIEASLAGETITVEKFFDFSMAQSTIDIWNAGGKELAILILIFSGVWPYTKQIITLLLWFMPPSVVSVARRGTVFYWLDALAKWSMVDIFALVIAIVSFRVSIESPDVAFLTEGFYSIDLMVVPMWGLYANMIAQLISQVSSHFIIHYHRRIVAVAKKDNELERQLRNGDTAMTSDNDSFRSGSEIETGEATEGQKEATQDEVRDQLYQHAFVRPHRGESDKLQVRHGVNACIVITALAVIILVIIGCSLPSFSVEVFGIIGLAVESGQGFQKAVNRYSIFDIVALLMEEARFLDSAGDYIGMGTLCILVILTVLVVPVVQALALLWQWFRPLGRRRRGRFTNVVEILQAWQYIEVYLIAVIVSAWQLGPVSDFMINAYCDGLSGTFATMVYYGILDPADAQCFMVQASIESATYMLITGAILLALLNTFVMKAVAQYNRDTDPSLARFAEKLKRIESTSSVSSDEEDVSKMIGKIHPVPVMFTDSFRWVLRREDSVPSSHSIVVLNHGTNDVEECLSTSETRSEAGSSKKESDVAVPPMYAFPAERLSPDDSSDSASDPAANMAEVSLD